MALWTLFGLKRGKATTSWPLGESGDGQDGLLGMPRYHPELCKEGCEACAEACPTAAITVRPEGQDRNGGGMLAVDYGRCVVCQLCTEACPTGAMAPSSDWAFGVARREDLVWSREAGSRPDIPDRPGFTRSLHIRHVDAGSCNGCESELQALNNPFYNLHRLGIFFTASPRFADLLLVTGPVTNAMLEPLRATYDAMPEPRWVMAVGTCAVSGGVAGGSYAAGHGLEGVLPVDVWLPGCPPNPAAIMEALLMFLNRKPQRITGGRVAHDAR
ncbi:NADH-quinone oxidoreductase subunit NuoB [Mesorhizobium sp. MSK_1335]|uniref:NADH-quinone oxidoreductase subunit NuoB n=1 Tax=Mesorhizobium montanum TaxID=3072323 RepID=A0ABU4ZS84_9HYPH|nr:NADH-quinone oxidoreductase subunit NuoB [Mesorhizobium sp. MSK_1335]MDX8528230.1 NADH-quinone oxidoreductase subunit NuoB [Mesorhizobium sp. MSK_1335]